MLNNALIIHLYSSFMLKINLKSYVWLMFGSVVIVNKLNILKYILFSTSDFSPWLALIIIFKLIGLYSFQFILFNIHINFFITLNNALIIHSYSSFMLKINLKSYVWLVFRSVVIVAFQIIFCIKMY
jgi:hypothetical protein